MLPRPHLLTAAVLAAAALCVHAEEASDAVTPYRPTISNPAQLPVPGQLEAELGGLNTRSDGSHRNAVPWLLKFGFDPQWGLLLGGEAHVWQHDDAGRASGAGDTTLTLKRAWLVDDATAYGAELAAKLPTADRRIGSGRADYTLNAIASRDFGPVHVDANLNATRLGAPDAGTGRARFGASASISTALSSRWGVTGEYAATHQAGEGNGGQLLAALTLSPTRRLTFDFGVARAFRPAPATTQVFAGVVFPIATLW